jgi:hypothetical protein
MSCTLSRIGLDRVISHEGIRKLLNLRSSPCQNFFSKINFSRGINLYSICGRIEKRSASIANIATFKSDSIAHRSFSTSQNFLNRKNLDGDTPLHLGVKIHVKKDSRYEICRLLLENGANPNIPDNHGKTPLDTAMDNGNIEMIILLKSYGGRVSRAELS